MHSTNPKIIFLKKIEQPRCVIGWNTPNFQLKASVYCMQVYSHDTARCFQRRDVTIVVQFCLNVRWCGLEDRPIII
jgi:hypothetical protein